MKTFKYILLLFSVSLLYACSKDENDLYKEERSSLLSSTQIGIYQNGKALLLFDKQAHQYYCNPSQKLFRIQDVQGKQYTALQLNALPSGQERTDGKVEGNMGIKLDGITQLYILQSDEQFVWLWSDDTCIGFILPNIGLSGL